MSVNDVTLSPAQARVWLKTVMSAPILGRIPPLYDAADGMPTAEYARHLLAELRNTEPNARSVPDVMADVRVFAQWVDQRMKKTRPVVVAVEDDETGAIPLDGDEEEEEEEEEEAPHARVAPVRAEDAEMLALHAKVVKRRDAGDEFDESVAPATAPMSDPMWDDFLDELGPK